MSDARRYAVWLDLGQSHEPLKVGNPPAPFTMEAGNWPLILKIGHNILIWLGHIFIFALVFVLRDFELGRNVSCEELTVTPSVPHVANLFQKLFAD